MTDARGQRTVLVVAVLASFVAFLDGSIVTVALPAVADDLGGDLTLQQWVVDAYLLTLGSLMLVAGSLSDTFGRVRVLRAGLVAFGATSLLAALAPDPGLLITARALQGVAAALLVPSSLALITSTFSGPAQGRAIGRWTAWTGVAFLVGPLAGGGLADTLGWRWVFGVVVVPVVLTLVLTTRLPDDAHRGTPDAPARIDVAGAVLAAVGLAGPVFALIEGQRVGFGTGIVLVPLVVGAASLVGFVWWERRAPQPMMPLDLFRTREFAVGNLATVGLYAALNLGTLTIPLVVQELAGLSATLAGLVTLPTTIVSLLFSTLFGTLAATHGPRLFMTVGPLVTAGGFLWMLLVREPIDVWWQVVPGVVLFGLGLAITVAPLTSAVLSQVPPARSGIASAVNNAISRVAGLVAVAFLGVVLGGALTVDGFHRVVVVVAVLLGASALVSFVGLRGSRRASSQPRVVAGAGSGSGSSGHDVPPDRGASGS